STNATKPPPLSKRAVCWSPVCSMRSISSVVGGTWGRNDVGIRSHTLQKLEEVAAGGKDKGRVFSDDGLVGLHRPCEFIERYRFRALVVGLRVDFGSFRVRRAADFLDLPVGFR